MKIQYHTSQANAINTWKALCAKNGLPEAADLDQVTITGMGQPALHELRKTARRAINKITDGMKQTDFDNATTDALLFAGGIVSSVNQAFEQIADAEHFFGRKQSNPVLRTSDDFERHYQSRSAANREDPFDIADFLRGVANLKTTPGVKNALSVGTDTGGGYAVPGILMPQILDALAPASSLLQAGAGIIPLDSGAKTFTTAAVDTIPSAAWRNESGSVAVSDPAFRAVVATPRSLSFMFKVSRELLADAVGLTDALNRTIAQAFAKELDRVGLRGTGTAPEPRGLLNTSGVHSVANGAAGTVLASYANLFSAVQAILAADAPMPTAAIMSPRSLVRLGALVDSTAQPVAVPPMLAPLKLIATSQIPNNLTVTSNSDCSEIYVGDFSRMFFAMREQVSIQLLNELYAGTGEIGFACHVRADVVVNYPAAFSVVTGVR